MIGALAGIVMIAQMAFLAGIKEHQGIAMGLFSTTSYLGMAALPFIAGLDRGFIRVFSWRSVQLHFVQSPWLLPLVNVPAGSRYPEKSVKMNRFICD